MKKMFLAIMAACIGFAVFGEEPISSGDIVPGEWNANYRAAYQYALDNNMPFIAIVSKNPAQCHFCSMFHDKWTSESFLAFARQFGAVMGAFYDNAPYEHDKSWVDWVRGSNSGYPMVRLYWKKKDGKIVSDQFMGRVTSLGDVDGDGVKGKEEDFIARIQKAFADWNVEPPYKGGEFAGSETSGDRLEFESGTKSVPVNLQRAATDATNVTLVVVGPDENELSVTNVVWDADVTNQTVYLNLPEDACANDGDQLTLYLRDDGQDKSTNHITYVDKPSSAANPLWIGEEFDFGEWTCDIDAAKDKVAAADGAAYTLVSIQGSMWCPDCANTDRNFLNATNAAGENAFQKWAKSKNIALVAMDVPNYNAKGSTPDTVASPTLFSTKGFATTLARAREYPASGADSGLTNAVVRSGRGYLTRKGVTPEQAAEVMERFHALATTNTEEGGFHRPEDSNAYRTGVPIFVLLRKDGTVAARFTRFAASSPMAADRENFDNYIKRFEEMLAIAGESGDHADAGEIANNYPGESAIPFAANGGTASNELCNADMQDAFKLVGVGGNAAQKVVVKGTDDAPVSVQFWQKKADSSFEAIGTLATGRLADGVELSYTFTEGGDYYLLVKGGSITDAAFDAASEVDSHFIGYTVTGATVFVPQGDQVTARAPEGSNKVMIRLEQGEVYRFSGIDVEANAGSLGLIEKSGAYAFVKGNVTGDVEITLTSAGGEITYQLWEPGEVGFVRTEKSVPESINDLDDDWVEFSVARTGGKSGNVKARVTVDLEKTTFPTERFVFETNALNAADFLWEDGVTSNQIVRVKIDDDMLFDGDAVIVFNLEVLASDAGDATVAEEKGMFTLTVVEDDIAAPGRGVITRTTPLATAGGAVYVREGEGAKVWVERIEASDGLVASELVSSISGTQYETEDPRDLEKEGNTTLLYWSSREYAEKYVLVKGIPAGKTARIQFKSHGDFQMVSGSNTVKIVSVADDAPSFVPEATQVDLYRYVAFGGAAIALDQATLQDGKVTFVKLSGTLPAGMKASYDESAKALSFTGVTTAKSGTYETVYQVVETRSGKRVPGLTTRVTFVVTDPTDLKTNPEGANPAVVKTRTFKDLAVLDPESKRLVGVLQLTIPAKGKVSGKYVSENGSVSLTSKNWSDYDLLTQALSARLTNAGKGIEATMTAKADGSVEVVVEDPMHEGVQLEAGTDGTLWSEVDFAEDWKGYYTVALPVENVVESATENLASTGAGYLTLDFTGKSALKTGTVRWAGMLPNGTAVSGSTVLGAPYQAIPLIGGDATDWVNLPVYSRSSVDTLSVYARIQRNADGIREDDRRSVLSAENVVSCWRHGERGTDVADYLVDLGVYGAIYDKNEDLAACCREYYQTNELLLGFDVSSLVTTSFGAPVAVSPLNVMIDETTVKLDPEQANPAGVKLSFSRSTGIVTGSFNMTCADAKLRATYKGVVLTGWGEGCGCGVTAGLKTLPFVNGSFYFTDKVEIGPRKTVNVKRGGSVMVDVE